MMQRMDRKMRRVGVSGHAAIAGHAAIPGHGAGSCARNVEGGLGGAPPPNVDGGHHFRRKYGFATKNAIFSTAASGLRAAVVSGNYVYILFF